jgi:HEAT repeat protein/energy-coupling factor transporter ATP-binding protein EcfA2
MQESDRERNYEQVDRAMRKLLVPALEVFIKRKMPEKLGEDWLKATKAALQSFNCNGDEPNWYDPQVLLKIISFESNWNKVFRVPGKFDVFQRGLINIMLGVRNENGHQHVDKFTNTYTKYFLDSMVMLLTAISGEETQEAERQNQEILRQYYPELSETVQESIKAGINWWIISRTRLEAENLGNLTTNPLTTGDGMAFKQDEIYVPLGFVERKEREKRSKDDGSPEKGAESYQEKVTPIEHDVFFRQVLEQGKRIAIIGEPGAGKTTQLQKIADWVLTKTEDVPIWITLGAIGTKPLREYLLSDWLRDAAQALLSAPPEWKEKRSLLNRALGELALQAIDNNESQARLREKFISDRLGDPEQEGSLFWLVRLLGWLNQVGVAVEDPDEKVYAFYHATFEEYFAALAIADWHFFLNHVPHNPAQGTYRLFEPQWKEVILLWLGREDVAKEQKEEFIEALYAFDQGCGELYAYQALFLSAAGIAEFKDYDSVDKVVYPLIELGFGNLNTHKNEWYNFPSWISKAARAALQETDRSCAADALIDLILTEPRQAKFPFSTAFEDLVILQPNSPAIVSHLLTWLDSADSDLWYDAILNLKKIGTGNSLVINGLLERLRKYYEDEISRWRSDQGRAVRWGESWSSYPTLRQWEECLEPSSWCDEVASAIGEIDPGNSEAVKLLIDLIRSAWDTPFGIDAALNLENIDSGNPEAINILTEFLQPSNDQFSRWRATKGLLNIAPKNPKVVRLLKDFLESLLQNSQNDYICKEAAKALIIVDPDHSDAIRLLIGKLYTSPPTRRRLTKKEVAELLGKTPEETEQLSDIPRPPTIEDWEEKEFDDILQQVTPGNREASSGLVELIKTCENQGARWIAASLLGQIGTNSSDVVDTL